MIALVALTPRPTQAQPGAWTEAEVARRASEQAPAALVARARSALSRARIEATPRHPDPTVAFQREQVLGEGDPYEMTLALGVPLDLSGRRSVARQLARLEAVHAEADEALARAEAVTLAVLAFVDVLAAERAVELERTALEALEEAARVLARREEEGAVAGYERVRLELEAELVRSTLAEAVSALDVARTVLRVMIAPDLAALPRLAGSLETADPSPLAAWQRLAREHDALEAARRAAGVADRAVDASGSAWVPPVELIGGGRVDGDAGGARWGYVAGASVSIPLFSGAHGLPAVARAERAASRARADALLREIDSDVAVAHAELVAARTEHGRFVEATGPRVDILLRGAESGYREGLRSIVELLDAQRAAAAVRRRALALEVQAKRAEARLRGAAGRWRGSAR